MELAKQQTYRTTATNLIGLLLPASLLLLSCTRHDNFPKWMCGKWKSQLDEIEITENWKCANGCMSGSTIWAGDGKTKVEKLRLFFRDHTLCYEVRLNQDRPVIFKCIDPKSDTLIFVNNQNDFPKRLVYVKPKGYKMDVWIDNNEKDPNRISFPFEKIHRR